MFNGIVNIKNSTLEFYSETFPPNFSSNSCTKIGVIDKTEIHSEIYMANILVSPANFECSIKPINTNEHVDKLNIPHSNSSPSSTNAHKNSSSKSEMLHMSNAFKKLENNFIINQDVIDINTLIFSHQSISIDIPKYSTNF